MDYVDTKQLKEDIMDGVNKALKNVGNQYGEISKKAGEVREKAGKYVQENPEKSVLIAAGAGALAAIIALKIIKGRM